MLDAAILPTWLPRASRSRGSTVNPYSTFTASTRPANQHWLCFGCLSAASLATFSWRFKLPVASVRLSRSRAKRRLGYRGRDRGAECCLASNPPERLHHAQPPAASLKLNHAIGIGPGLGQSFRRRRPPRCAERRVPIRGVTSGLAGTERTILSSGKWSGGAIIAGHTDASICCRHFRVLTVACPDSRF